MMASRGQVASCSPQQPQPRDRHWTTNVTIMHKDRGGQQPQGPIPGAGLAGVRQKTSRTWRRAATAGSHKAAIVWLTGRRDAVDASTAGDGGSIVVAGAGYAGLHVALRLTAKLRNH